MTTLLAYDLGASSGRLVAQKYDGKKLTYKEIHRFMNKPVYENEHYYWNYSIFLEELKKGISKVGDSQATIGIDTWGVDFGLVRGDGSLIASPFSYRDEQSQSFVQEAMKSISSYDLFQRTGNEVAAINSLYQLMAIQQFHPHLLKEANQILMMPNLIIHSLCGVAVNEYTIASTTQLLNVDKEWDSHLQKTFFSKALPLAPLMMPHKIVGEINNNIKIALVPGHDTACALLALPLQQTGAVFLSLGTWGLIGKEVTRPITSYEAFEAGFTNEGTSEGTYRFQKNAMGFWILQKLREEWRKEGFGLSYEEEITQIHAARPFQIFIDPDDSSFFNPSSMTDAIHQYCDKTKQPQPVNRGAYIRCFLESLALKVAYIVQRMESITDEIVNEIYIGGGGTQNKVLCQFIANASGKVVYTGPVEASSIGNGLSQLRALGEINNAQEGRQIVRNSFSIERFEPQDEELWQEGKAHFLNVLHGEKQYEKTKKH